MYDSSAKKAIIQRFYNYLYSIVLDTISKNELYTNNKFLLRSGATKSYSLTKEKKILRYIQNFHKDIYKQVIWAY
jgi:hypothetical protein